MIIAFVIDNEQMITNFDNDFTIQIYEYNQGLPTLIKNINFIIKEEILENLYLSRCQVLVMSEVEEEFKKKAQEYRIEIWDFGKLNIQNAISKLKTNDGMKNTQRFVEPYELDHDFDIGYYDDDDIGGS